MLGRVPLLATEQTSRLLRLLGNSVDIDELSRSFHVRLGMLLLVLWLWRTLIPLLLHSVCGVEVPYFSRYFVLCLNLQSQHRLYRGCQCGLPCSLLLVARCCQVLLPLSSCFLRSAQYCPTPLTDCRSLNRRALLMSSRSHMGITPARRQMCVAAGDLGVLGFHAIDQGTSYGRVAMLAIGAPVNHGLRGDRSWPLQKRSRCRRSGKMPRVRHHHLSILGCGSAYHLTAYECIEPLTYGGIPDYRARESCCGSCVVCRCTGSRTDCG